MRTKRREYYHTTTAFYPKENLEMKHAAERLAENKHASITEWMEAKNRHKLDANVVLILYAILTTTLLVVVTCLLLSK